MNNNEKEIEIIDDFFNAIFTDFKNMKRTIPKLDEYVRYDEEENNEELD